MEAKRTFGPYPETITDEVSGTEVPNDRYRLWNEGFKAGQEGARKEIFTEIDKIFYPMLASQSRRYKALKSGKGVKEDEI